MADRYEEAGYDKTSDCSYKVIVAPIPFNLCSPNRTISLAVSYMFDHYTKSAPAHHHRSSRFCLTRAPDTGLISGLEDVNTWLKGSPGFSSAVGKAATEVVTRALCELPKTTTVIVTVRVWWEEREARRVRAAMEKVKEVVIKEKSEESCVVCWEEFRVGCDAVRLPCDHVFHGDCIEKWFEKRIICPLCSFELSVDEVADKHDASKIILKEKAGMMTGTDLH